MKIADQIYQCTSKKLIDIFAEDLGRKRKVNNSWYKYAKSKGAVSDRIVVGGSSDHEMLLGVLFKAAPDPALWKKAKDGAYYLPTRKTKEGRALHKEWCALEEWRPSIIVAALGWKNMYSDCRHYTLGYFSNLKGFCGIKVPIFDDETYKGNPDLKYKPVKGLKPITVLTYKRKFK